MQKYALPCGTEGCKHPILGSSLGTKCDCLNSAWLQQYAGDLGYDNICGVGYPWTCTVCMEARVGLSDHYGLTPERHMEETLHWLMELIADTSNVTIASVVQEVC